MASHPVKKKGSLKGYIEKDLGVRASVVVMTDLLENVCQLQKNSPSSSVALGRLLIGSVLVAGQLKDKQAVSFQVMGDGEIKRVFAHAQYDGLCRGYISERQAALALDHKNIILKPLIGNGFLQALTYTSPDNPPQISQVELQSGEIGEDIAFYLSQSCQIPCLISLAVKIGSEGRVVAAGGVLIELMPGHSEETLSRIENHQKFSLPLSSLIEEGLSHRELLSNYLPIDVKEIKEHEVSYSCTCSRKKARRSLQMLEATDFQEILTSREALNVDCEMCGLIYSFLFEEIEIIYKESGKMIIH